MLINVEYQLMRDWQPRSRPTRGLMDLDGGEQLTKLMPGAAAVGHELMTVTVTNTSRIHPHWVTAMFFVTIEGIILASARPGTMWLGVSDTWSAAIHYPLVADEYNHMFRGWHTLLVRAV